MGAVGWTKVVLVEECATVLAWNDMVDAGRHRVSPGKGHVDGLAAEPAGGGGAVASQAFGSCLLPGVGAEWSAHSGHLPSVTQWARSPCWQTEPKMGLTLVENETQCKYQGERYWTDRDGVGATAP